MSLHDAMMTVLDLARQGMVQEQETLQDAQVLGPERRRQEEAIGQVHEAFALLLRRPQPASPANVLEDGQALAELTAGLGLHGYERSALRLQDWAQLVVSALQGPALKDLVRLAGPGLNDPQHRYYNLMCHIHEVLGRAGCQERSFDVTIQRRACETEAVRVTASTQDEAAQKAVEEVLARPLPQDGREHEILALTEILEVDGG